MDLRQITIVMWESGKTVFKADKFPELAGYWTHLQGTVRQHETNPIKKPAPRSGRVLNEIGIRLCQQNNQVNKRTHKKQAAGE